MGALLAGTAAVLAFGIGGAANAASDKGANAGGTYDSSGQFSGPSKNGGDNGLHKGRPAAGTVGNADDKNPPGQQPSGVAGADGNKGYECDENSGVGKGNPAHSTCAQSYGGDGPSS